MIKDEFNRLSLEKQVEYINSMLHLKTLTKACDELKIARSTINGRFKKGGYTLDLTQNKYILDKTTKEIKVNDDNDIKELLEMKDKLKLLIEWFDGEQAGTLQKDFNIDLDKFEGEAINRTFVVYPNVLDRYVKFCESHRAYRRQDIIGVVTAKC
jgi:hypothetical protein